MSVPSTLALYADLLNSDQVWYSSTEAADALGMTSQFVRNAFESQAIMGHEVSASPTAKRRIKMIHRDCLLIYLMQTANFTEEDLLRHLHKVLGNRTADQLEKIGKWVDKQVAIKRGKALIG